jgi:hypothetical protein
VETIPSEESARYDAEADAEFDAGIGIPLKEAFAWLHDLVDGVEHRCREPANSDVSRASRLDALLLS